MCKATFVCSEFYNERKYPEEKCTNLRGNSIVKFPIEPKPRGNYDSFMVEHV